ncbi:MAG: hypothetical protein ACRC6F_08740 [Aeromonas sp.]
MGLRHKQKGSLAPLLITSVALPWVMALAYYLFLLAQLLAQSALQARSGAQ